MMSSLYNHMQAAVDIVETSPHPANKIAATIAGEGFALSRVNTWPAAIVGAIGTQTAIGNSSGTIHAETACILSAPKTEGASIFVTDPPCPNCMKNMAEAGIGALYIDHKGFDKDWAKRRGDSFEAMSIRIAEKAGIDIHIIYRKEQRFEIISSHTPGYKPPIENPPKIEETAGRFDILIETAHKEMANEPFVLAMANNPDGKSFSILVNSHPTIGYTSDTMEKKEDKYSFLMEPLSRALMIAARHGLKVDAQHLYSSRVPTARELVNLLGARLDQIQIGDMSASRDENGPQALQQLKEAQILRVD